MEEFRDELNPTMAWTTGGSTAYGLCPDFTEEVNTVRNRGRVGSFHASRDVEVKSALFLGEVMLWYS